MADSTLHGNHRRGGACKGTGKKHAGKGNCYDCHGRGWLPLSDSEIAEHMVRMARAHYWPAFDARAGAP